MIVCNDIFAYIAGFFFGRTPLIKLSPKKTVEVRVTTYSTVLTCICTTCTCRALTLHLYAILFVARALPPTSPTNFGSRVQRIILTCDNRFDMFGFVFRMKVYEYSTSSTVQLCRSMSLSKLNLIVSFCNLIYEIRLQGYIGGLVATIFFGLIVCSRLLAAAAACDSAC